MRRIAYLSVAAYLAVQAGAYFTDNTGTTGSVSSAYLVLATLAVVLLAATLAFMTNERAGRLAETPMWHGARIAWVSFALLLIVVRIVAAFQLNQETVGFDSAINAAWFISSFLVAGLLFVVARSPARPAAEAPTTNGSTVGKYEIRGLLGRGAMGTVHDGWDPLIGRRVAIKTILLANENSPDGSGSGGFGSAARFRREAQAAGRLLHPNVVSVFDYEEAGGTAYLVMEFVDGQPLGDWLSKQNRPPLFELLRIMDDILIGLGYCHEHGVIHRDIKPANIMLTREGRAKLADFGIARVDNSSVTQTGMVTGTAAYMSPEQFSGGPVDARTDIYACGVLLYLMLTGERPFSGAGMTEVMYKVLTTEVPSPSALVPVPPAFDAVVKRAMAKLPEDRFPSAGAFAAALRDVAIPPDDATTVLPRG